MNPSRPMAGKICMVTGETSGIGAATALALARHGARTIVVGRNRKKAEKYFKRIKAKTGNTSVDCLIADLSSQREIRQLAEEFKRRYPRLDVLINNAGGRFLERRVTVDGYEWTLAVNHQLLPEHWQRPLRLKMSRGSILGTKSRLAPQEPRTTEKQPRVFGT